MPSDLSKHVFSLRAEQPDSAHDKQYGMQATAGALLKGRRPSYRESLLQVRDRLDINCPSGLPTPVRTVL